MSTRNMPMHSPSPWTTIEQDLHDTKGVHIGNIRYLSGEDRRLILKAPELLVVCRKVVLDAEENGATVLVAGSTQHAAMKALVDHIDGGD